LIENENKYLKYSPTSSSICFKKSKITLRLVFYPKFWLFQLNSIAFVFGCVLNFAMHYLFIAKVSSQCFISRRCGTCYFLSIQLTIFFFIESNAKHIHFKTCNAIVNENISFLCIITLFIYLFKSIKNYIYNYVLYLRQSSIICNGYGDW